MYGELVTFPVDFTLLLAFITNFGNVKMTID
jgi:hypothetical protein